MRPDADVHDALARLLEYPREHFLETAAESVRTISAVSPEATEVLVPFTEFVNSHALHELEEMFTRTFDNNADRALEVGWHTFGENYTRGTFMVRMRQRLREHGIEENGELPDHLSHVLSLLGRADARWSGDMAHDTVAPAVTKIHDALVEQQNPWADVLAAVQIVLQMHEHSPRRPVGADVPSSWPPTPPPLPSLDPGTGNDFDCDTSPGCGAGEEFRHE